MGNELQDIWVYLSASPLAHLTLTLIAFQFGSIIYQKLGMNPLLNPVMIAVVIVVAFLIASGTSYEEYFEGAQFIHFLLGPATVALAIPLYRQFERVRKSAIAILASILAGSMTAALSAIYIGKFMSASPELLISLAPKPVTAPVAMGITEKLGGLP